MISSWSSAHRACFAMTIALASSVLVGCQSLNFGTNPSSAAVQTQDRMRPADSTAPSYTFYPYNISSAANTLITGISSNKNSIRFIATTYPNSGSPYSSFIADVSGATITGGPTDEPPNHKPPNTYLSKVADDESGINNYSVGYLIPGTTTASTCQTTAVVVACGLVYDPAASGARYRVVDQHQGSRACAGTYLYGTSDPHIQVGYYTTGNAATSSGCVEHAVEEYTYPSGCSSPPCQQFVDFQFPASFGTVTNSKAYGINNYGDVVGTFTASATGTLEIGWKFRDFTYSILQYQLAITGTPSPVASPTEPRDISWSGSVVGSYKDAGGASHGFLRYYKGDGWYAENCCNTTSTYRTVIYGTDDPAYLTGAYKTTANGSWNGFYAKCTGGC